MNAMNALAKMAQDICDSGQHCHLIVSPTKKLLKTAFILFIIAVTLLVFSIGIIMIITIPLLSFEVYYYYLFCKLWKSFRFSTLYLILLPTAAIVVSLFIRYLIYYL